jgi:hypothetical protein
MSRTASSLNSPGKLPSDMDYELVKLLKEDGLRWSTVDLFEAKGNEVHTEN